ncbi:MAG: endolytic transglycosylase MltG [Clostridiaceae bacterium]|jgi:UPF0755 protein|nr:endolytic transglycosylase MltG [Clostridiaceae bacterium]
MTRNVTKSIVILIVVLLIIGFVIAGFITGYRYVLNQDERFANLRSQFDEHGFSPITKDTPNAIEVYIPQQADSEIIGEILVDKGLISNLMAFKLISKFNGFDGQYQYGTHYLVPGLAYDEIMVLLTNQPEPVTVTIYEGMTYLDIKDKLLDAGMRFNPELLDMMMNQPSLFIDFSFVRQIEAKPGREWLLQGYLWPDTYRFDINATEQQIIRTFLSNTEYRLRQGNYQDRAEKIGMSLDEVLTLASVVQQEGPIVEMPKIARVFMNRLDQGMPLQSCATINYLRKEEGKDARLWIFHDDIERYGNNPYNTYSFSGLPPGPINSPGLVAIEGVLWPATDRTWPDAGQYLFFCARGDGSNDFSKTSAEHDAKVARYSAAP